MLGVTALDLAKRIATLWSPWQGSLSRRPHDHPEGKPNPETLRVPPDDKCRGDGLIVPRRGAEEIDDRDLLLHRIPEQRLSGEFGPVPMNW
jgi:hypothetical protein